MKFACEQCKTKYTIADERVRGKVLKIRCKSCSHVMVVREEVARAHGASGPIEVQVSDRTVIGAAEAFPTAAEQAGAEEEWHLSVNGVVEGPHALAALAQRIAELRKEGGVQKELFVWRDGFEDWLPPQVVQEVFAAVERHKADHARKLPPPPPDAGAPSSMTAPARLPRAPSLPPAAPKRSAPPVEPEPPSPAPAAEPPPAAEASQRSGGFELAFSEPSMLIDLGALLRNGRAQSGVGPADPTVPVTTGPEAEPQALPMSAASPAHLPPPAPPLAAEPQVLVVTGPAPSAPRYLKAVLAAALCCCVLLLGTVAYLLTREPPQVVKVEGAQETEPGGKFIKDRPVQAVQGVQEGLAATNAPDGGVAKAGGAQKKVQKGGGGRGPGGLSSSQERLRALYGQDGERGVSVPAVPSGGDSQRSKAAPSVSLEELGQVVARNRKSVSLCYERFLKHDESLRNAKLNVALKIGISGMASQVSIAGPIGESELGRCVQKAIRLWRFPGSAEEYEFEFPLVLTAS